MIDFEKTVNEVLSTFKPKKPTTVRRGDILYNSYNATRVYKVLLASKNLIYESDGYCDIPGRMLTLTRIGTISEGRFRPCEPTKKFMIFHTAYSYYKKAKPGYLEKRIK